MPEPIATPLRHVLAAARIAHAEDRLRVGAHPLAEIVRDPRQRAFVLELEEQRLRPERRTGDDHLARGPAPAGLRPGERRLGEDLVAGGAGQAVERPDVDHPGLGVDLGAALLGEVEISLSRFSAAMTVSTLRPTRWCASKRGACAATSTATTPAPATRTGCASPFRRGGTFPISSGSAARPATRRTPPRSWKTRHPIRRRRRMARRSSGRFWRDSRAAAGILAARLAAVAAIVVLLAVAAAPGCGSTPPARGRGGA